MIRTYCYDCGCALDSSTKHHEAENHLPHWCSACWLRRSTGSIVETVRTVGKKNIPHRFCRCTKSTTNG